MSKDKDHRPSESETGHLFLWHPKATISPSRMQTKGLYAKGYPEGAVIHYTAGPYKNGVKDALNCIKEGISNEYAYLCIASDGTVVQAHPLNEWGYHAGQSYWAGLGKSLSSKLIGIELCSAGKVKLENGVFKSWWGETIPGDDVRFVDESHGCEKGFYHAFTLEQERALWGLLMWLYENDPQRRFKFENVLGHHEIAGTTQTTKMRRKFDPGGSLSLSMEMLRNGLLFHSEENLADGFNGYEN
jgi:N-acetyl-anhydromuramyl-L-alanine amidase AmpD